MSLSLERKERYLGLDFLRGICALAVVIYHVQSWQKGVSHGVFDGVLAWFGLYCVSIFFIISGYSLAIAYERKFSEGINSDVLKQYFKRRAGRLLPLFFLVLIISVLGKLLVTNKPVFLFDFLTNVFLLFGFFDSTATPVVGGWSIGVEVVFYVILPVLLLDSKRPWIWFLFAVALTIWISGDVAQGTTLESKWTNYAAPANHMIFFVIGVFLRTKLPYMPIPGIFITVAIISVMGLVVFLSYAKSELVLVTGFLRLIMIGLSSLFVYLAAAASFTGYSPVAEFWGRVSYPLYLIHPIVYFGGQKIYSQSSFGLLEILGLSLIMAIILDCYFDRPIQRWLAKVSW